MRIGIVRPHTRGPEDGNRRTATRWAGILESLGAEVWQADTLGKHAPDLLVALHALKSGESVLAFRAAHPDRPLVLCLTGTDVYGARSEEQERLWSASLAAADRLVLLQGLAAKRLPEEQRPKARVIHQSFAPAVIRKKPPGDHYPVAFLANIRAVKDPLTAVRACELLPSDSRIRVVHAGSVIDLELGRTLAARASRTPRFETRGGLPYAEALALLASSHLALSTSIEEGGANALSEAVVLGTPVLASSADGNLGVLGQNYPGIFPAGDAEALAALLRRWERDTAFREELHHACAKRAPLFQPERERAAWGALLEELLGGREEPRD